MIFILDRQERVINILKNGSGVSNTTPFFDDLLTEDLATGAETFTFSTIATGSVASDLSIGNYIAFKKDKSYKLFQIMQTEESHEDIMYMTVYCESAGLELINKVFRGRKMTSFSLRRFLETVLDETGWNVGGISVNSQNSFDFDLEDASVYSVLQNNIGVYDVELEFRVEIEQGRISRKYVDTYATRGRVTGKRFTFGRDIESITRKVDSTELCTALIGQGKNGLNFRDITIEGIDKPAGQDFVADQEAFDRYNNNGYHIMGVYYVDTEDKYELLRETHKQLQSLKTPKIEYEVSVAMLGELIGEDWNTVSIGDTVAVVDNAFNPPIHLMARVTKLETSFTDPNSNKCTIANFVEVKSNITEEMRKLASQLEGYVDNQFPIGGDKIQDGAIGETQMDSSYIEGLTTDIITANTVRTKELIAEYAEITDAKIENLEAENAEIENAIINNANITNANIESLKAKDAEIENAIITNANITNAKIEDLIAKDAVIENAIIDNAEITFAKIDQLEANVGKIDAVISGNISSENIQTGGITGENLNMETIFVKDANILDLSASKLTAGEINTSQIVITSEDGGMRLVGSTQQFIDENDRIRIQLGKDAKGDFDFYILAENGDILFNTRGITGNAIENGLIKEDMVSDGAIGGKKINWQSFTTEFNKDSNTHKLNSSKVLLDGTNQTLDIHFNRLNSTVNDNVNKTESNTTQLNVHQGKINTLIQDTTITKDGKNVKLKDEYSKLEQTVGGIKTSVGQQQTTINEHTGKITATESKVSTLEQTVNGFNSELSHVKTTIDEQEEAINSVNSALSGKANSNDVYKKSETMTTSAINSAINQSADSIKLGISETYETKTNVENKISSANTTTLNSAKSYADTKKNEAITQAGKDADSKVNSAKNELNTAINKKANSVDVYKKSETYTKSETDSAINVAKDSINIGVSQTYETKANVESKVSTAKTEAVNTSKSYADTKKAEAISTASTDATNKVNSAKNELNTKIDEIQIGGRNLLLNSDNGYLNDLNVYNNTNVTYSNVNGWRKMTFTNQLNNEIVHDKWFAPTQLGNYTFSIMCRTDATSITSDISVFTHESGHRTVSASVKNLGNGLYRIVSSFSISNLNRIRVVDLQNFKTVGATYVEFRYPMLEVGNKVSAWSQAPEDVDSAINKKANSTDVYTKTEVYTKAQTDSAIKVAKDEINLGVSSTYETKANVESKVSTAKTEAVNTSKSYADTKKAEAISTASTDATNKVNSAKNELNTAINKKANSVDVYKKSETYTKSETDSKINIAKDQINLNVSNTYETKANVETKVNNAVDNIQVGGRNLWIEKNLINAYESNGNATSSTSQHKMMNTYTDLNGAKYVTVQLWNPNSFNNNSNSNRIAFYDSNKTWISSIGTPKPNGTTYVSGIITVPTNAKYMKIGMVTGDSQHESSIRIKVELGNKPSDWTQSPEDINSAIDSKANSTDVYKKSETYTKSETDSKINVAKNDITLSVSNTYETKTNVETKVNNAVNNIQIGGRNLFLNSGFTKGLNYWYTYNCSNPQAVADSSALSGYAVKFTSTGGGIYQRKGGASNNPTNYQNGSVMTVSGYVKSSVAGKVLRPNFENAGANTSKNITCTNANTWYYFTHTYTITSHGFSTITFYGDSGADYYLKDVILEYGNKASTWTSAPEDIDSAIETKANASDVYNKTEVYTKTETTSQINVAKDSITNTVAQTYLNKNDASNTYATKSEVTQTANQITYSFSSSGGMNLVKDGQFKSWEFNAGKWEYNEDAFRIYGRGSNDPEGTSIGFYSATDGKVDLYQYVKFKPNTTYTFRADIYKEPNIWWYSVILDFYDGRGNYLGSHTCTEAGNTFTTPSNCYKGVLVIRHGGTSNFNGHYVLYVNNVAIYEGTMELPYSPHPEEIYEGITKIDANGVQVSHTGANTTTHMNNQGFFIYNSQGETVGSLATETGLSVVNANKVYADNIRNIYEGDGTLYVNHNYTGDSDGTSSRPFKTFADLRTYLEVTPIINKDVTVNIVSTSEITEPLVMDNLSGRGTLKFQYAKTCIHRTNNTHMWCISMANINLPLQIHGGRSSYNTSDGAILCDNGNQHGIKLVNCPNFYISSIAINCKNWGIHLSNCQGTTTSVDFCQTYCALELRDRSHVYDSDACGNCGDFFRVFTGSIFVYGSNGGGYRPYGNKIEGSGRYLLVGAERTQTNSFRTPPPAPTTSDQYGTWSMRDYGYFTYGRNGVNVNSWNPGSKRIQQGEWSGYGNNYGFAFFDDSNIRSWLANGTPKDGSTITLKRASSGGYSSSQPVYLCGATNTSCSGTPSGVKSYGKIGSLAWGETKTFNIPTSFVNDLKSGAIKSVCFYDSSGASYVKIDSVSIKLKANKPV